MFNNERAGSNWGFFASKSNTTTKREERFLSLTATIKEIKKKILLGNNSNYNDNENGGGNGNRQYQNVGNLNGGQRELPT